MGVMFVRCVCHQVNTDIHLFKWLVQIPKFSMNLGISFPEFIYNLGIMLEIICIFAK